MNKSIKRHDFGCTCGFFLERLLVTNTRPAHVCQNYLHMPNLLVLGTHLLGLKCGIICGVRWLMHCVGTTPEVVWLESGKCCRAETVIYNRADFSVALAEGSIFKKIDGDPVDGESLCTQT